MFCKIPMFAFGERLIDYLQAYECFLGALGLESSFMSFAVGRFCPTPEAADLIVLDFWDNLRKLNAKDKYFDATNDCLILTDLDAGKDRQLNPPGTLASVRRGGMAEKTAKCEAYVKRGSLI